MKHLWIALKILICFTVVFGLIYPLFTTGVAQLFFPAKANGGRIERDGILVGAKNLAQSFEQPRYFWPRPSAVAYNSMPSGGSNLSPTSIALFKAVAERRENLERAHPHAGEVPVEMLTASASGLDPEISPASAHYQAARVAEARGVPVEEVLELIAKSQIHPQLGFLGTERVNVLELNMSLDSL